MSAWENPDGRKLAKITRDTSILDLFQEIHLNTKTTYGKLKELIPN